MSKEINFFVVAGCGLRVGKDLVEFAILEGNN